MTNKQAKELATTMAQIFSLAAQELTLWAGKLDTNSSAVVVYRPDSDKGILHALLQENPKQTWTNFTAADKLGWTHGRTASTMNGIFKDGWVESVDVVERGIKVWRVVTD